MSAGLPLSQRSSLSAAICLSSSQCAMQALAQSTAIDTALGHILGLPEPWAMEQSLASFLGVLMHEEGSRPEKLASAIVGIAGAAGKDGGKVSLQKTLLFQMHSQKS